MDKFWNRALCDLIYRMLTGPGGGDLVTEALSETGADDILAGQLSHYVIRHGVDGATDPVFSSVFTYLRGCVTDDEIAALANEMAADEKEQLN